MRGWHVRVRRMSLAGKVLGRRSCAGTGALEVHGEHGARLVSLRSPIQRSYAAVVLRPLLCCDPHGLTSVSTSSSRAPKTSAHLKDHLQRPFRISARQTPVSDQSRAARALCACATGSAAGADSAGRAGIGRERALARSGRIEGIQGDALFHVPIALPVLFGSASPS